jgi:two-component system CheB/CheR fusion protein
MAAIKKSTTKQRRHAQAFPIAGIGASAGGLEAFTQLLQHLPADTGIGLVLVQHLDPVHESELARLLARVTTMPVREVTNDMRVERNCVYVIPPDALMSIVNGRLKLAPRRKSRKPQHAIDLFFESLAQDQHECAIGVVLSGTGSDGTVGLEAVKAEGGITFAQDESAKYDSMPRAAIAAGCVDFVLSPENIADELARLAKHPYLAGDAEGRQRELVVAHQDDDTALPSGGRKAPGPAPAQARVEAERISHSAGSDGLKKVLLRLRNHSGVDFSLYKSSTIQRRIMRRMVLGKHDTLDEYAKFLQGNSQELDTLFSDVLISVTGFFRNPDAFEVLKRVVFPKLVKRRRDDAVRVWVLGCSTGQEAYSVAMAYSESVDSLARAPKLQVFATDLNDKLLEKARAGLYAKSVESDISQERLHRFFAEEEGGYRVIKPLREAVVFARQNLVSDPPFSRMDLICCRNLLIYLEPSLQRKALPTFHYALKPEGFLFLGASESVGTFTDLFETVDRKHKIFAKKPGPTPIKVLPAVQQRPRAKARLPIPAQPSLPATMSTELSAQREADRLMVNEFAPPGVIVDADLQIVQFRGGTAQYLAPPRGKASFDVLKMAREGLMLPLRAAINKARKENQPVRKEGIDVGQDGRSRKVNLEVIPLRVKERFYLVLFEDAIRPAKGSAKLGRTTTSPTASAETAEPRDVKALRRRLAQAERELAETRDYLQAMQEQHDAANEELQASSEEAQSTNEELQSINEELETSKEELESTNEELTTVNEEMAHRNVELNRLNADLNNLHVSIHTAIVVLGRDLTVRRFTPLAQKTFDLQASDLGRPLTGIRHALYVPSSASPDASGESGRQPLDLEQLVREVIDTLAVRECEVQDRDGRWYSLRVRPYTAADNRIDGAVLALLDIDALKHSEREAEAARQLAEATIRTVRDPLVALDGALRVKMANDAFYRTFHVTREETDGKLIYELGAGQWNIPALRTLLEDILPRDTFFDDFEVTHDFPHLGTRTMIVNGRRLQAADGANDLILLGLEDITKRKQGDEQLQHALRRFRLLAETVPEKIFTANPSGDRDYLNQQWLEYAGQRLDDLAGSGWTHLICPEDRTESQRRWSHSMSTGEPYYFEHRLRRHDSESRWHVTRAVALKDVTGAVIMWVGADTDVHDVKESDRRKDEFLATLAHELRNPLAPLSAAVQLLRQSEATTDKRSIDIMHRQVNHMVRLVEQLIDVSRISRGNIDLRKEKIELASVLHQAVEAVRPHVESKQQQLTVTLTPEPVYVEADPARVAQVVGNLLNNASKFTHKGGRIALTVDSVGAQVVIHVRDTGIGLAEDQIPRIFDMFMQVDTSLERSQSGLGIGLTLAKRLVEMHGGTIEARSAGLGKGSEFCVRLPTSSKPPAALPLAEPPVGVSPRSILIVDDNPDTVTLFGLLLQRQGHEIHIAHDGLEAVAAAAELRPDVVLLDVGLPKLDGYEAARRIRQQAGAKKLLLIAVTGWGQDEDRRRSKEAGFDAHLVKPMDITVLNELLRTYA